MPQYTYRHRTTGEKKVITAPALNRAREQVDKKEWQLVSCHMEGGKLCWLAKDVGLDF